MPPYSNIPWPWILMAGMAIFLFVWELGKIVLVLKDSATAMDAAKSDAASGQMLPEDRLRIKVVLAVIMGSLFGMLGMTQISKLQSFSVASTFLFLLLIVIAGYISFFLPDKVFQYLYTRRLEKMNRQLIDAMNVLAMALRSGRTLEGALPLVATQIPMPLANEFERAVQEIKVGGVLLDDALRRLAERVPIKDMHIFVSTVLIVNKVGGSQADILEKNAHLIRERFRIKQKIHALTAEGRFSAFAISLAPLAVLMINFLIDPETMTMFVTNPIGMLALFAIGVSDYIGYMILSKQVQIEF